MHTKMREEKWKYAFYRHKIKKNKQLLQRRWTYFLHILVCRVSVYLQDAIEHNALTML